MLENNHGKWFPRGSELTCILHTQKPLGNLMYIRIWHDNTGDSASWFLDRVVIRRLETKSDLDEEQWFFMVNDWLAVEYGDGKVTT